MNTARELWNQTFAAMNVGEVIEVSDWDYPEATRYMPAGYTAHQKQLRNGHVLCTISRKR